MPTTSGCSAADSAHGLGPWGRGFESRHPGHWGNGEDRFPNKTASPIGHWAEILRGEDPGDICRLKGHDPSAGTGLIVSDEHPFIVPGRLSGRLGQIKTVQSAYSINRFAGVAQLVEHLPRKQRVGSSNLPVSSMGVQSPNRYSFRACSLSLAGCAASQGIYAGVAQLEERPAIAAGRNDGSSPSIGTRGTLLPQKELLKFVTDSFVHSQIVV